MGVVVVAGDELVPPLALAVAAHDGPQAERADLIEGGRRRSLRRFGVRSEDDRRGPVHGQHRHPGHHVLEPAVRFDPGDAPAERL